jgi:outer membrane protein assembly factor BamB
MRIAVKRSRLLLLLLLTALAGAVYLQVRRTVGPIDARDIAAVHAFEQRLASENGSDRWAVKIGDSTVTIDEDAGRVVRRDAAGRVEWSTRIGDSLRTWWSPALLTDGHRVYVKQQSDGVTALDAGTGEVAWREAGPCECFRLSGDLLVLANGPRVVGLAAASGAEVFRLSLPADPDFWPGTIGETTGLFLVQGRGAGWDGPAFLIDRTGVIRHRVGRQVLAVVPAGPDRVFLTGADVRRVSADDRTVWSAPFESTEWVAGGGILEAPGGDLLAFVYCRIANSGVQVMRLDPITGEVRWRVWCGGLPGVVHSKYHHDATAEWVGDHLRVISKGSAGAFVELLDGSTGERVRRGERREQ